MNEPWAGTPRSDLGWRIYFKTWVLAAATSRIFQYLTMHKQYRYSQDSDTRYSLRVFHNGRDEFVMTDMDDMPEWLRSILSVAEVGGHLKHPPAPPPKSLLWFTTTEDNALISFTEFTP